jgi:hypothetical protein
MQRRSDIAIACMWQQTRKVWRYCGSQCPLPSAQWKVNKWFPFLCSRRCTLWELFSKRKSRLTLTLLRPTRSATVPLTIAPSIAPMVSIEPKREYCIRARFVSVADEQDLVSFSVKSFTALQEGGYLC